MGNRNIKKCPTCKKDYVVSSKNFYKRIKNKRLSYKNISPVCKKCNRIKSKEFRRRLNNNKKEEYFIKAKTRRYNITPEYLRFILNENKRCKICNIEFNEKIKQCLDHCHYTQKIRGVLCSNCNTGLGYFKNNVSNLALAITYLNENS